MPIPVNARRMRVELKDRIGSCSHVPRRRWCGSATKVPAGKQSSQAAHQQPRASDLLRQHGLFDQVTLYKLDAAYPLLEEPLAELLTSVDRLLVLEELSPFLEDAVSALCARRGLTVRVLGKRSGHLPEEFEYEPDVIERRSGGSVGPSAKPAPAPGRIDGDAADSVAVSRLSASRLILRSTRRVQ